MRNKRLEPGMVLLSNEFCRFCKGKKGTWRFRGGVSLYGERKGMYCTGIIYHIEVDLSLIPFERTEDRE